MHELPCGVRGMCWIHGTDGCGATFRAGTPCWRFDEPHAAAAQGQALELEANREGEPVRALELGSFEGLSASWLLQRVLVSPNAELVCVDIFTGAGGAYDPPGPGLYREAWNGSYGEAFTHNLALARNAAEGGLSAASYTAMAGTTLDVLTHLHAERTREGKSLTDAATYDFVYVDANHRAFHVLQDIALVWPLVRPLGIVVFDDYLDKHWTGLHETPRAAVDAAMSILVSSGEARLAHVGYQVVLQKLEQQAPEKHEATT